MNTRYSSTEQATHDEAYSMPRANSSSKQAEEMTDKGYEPAHDLGLWLRALSSFFQPRNHPLSQNEQAHILTRNWINEISVAHQALLHSTQLALQVTDAEIDGTLFDAAGEAKTSSAPSHAGADAGTTVKGYSALAGSLADTAALCEALLESHTVGFQAWASIGRILARELEHSAAAQNLLRTADHFPATKLQEPLLHITRSPAMPVAVSTDILLVFTVLARLLERLGFVESLLRRDYPLKQALMIFTLVHEEARALLNFIESRAMRVEGLDEAVVDMLDGVTYVIANELRKVFGHELAGLCEVRQATTIYARVETGHGLLSDCFKQSTLMLAQQFDPTLDMAQLFNSFQLKLEKSLALRRDLWNLLQLVQRTFNEADSFHTSLLLEHLVSFQDNSMRLLMYKDWEACERFIEEIAGARGAVELAPVIHRFAAYLETLYGQVNMRAVLADHPFDHMTSEL